MTQLNRVASLDGVRALAALLVMGFHFVGQFGGQGPEWIRQASVAGQTGVDLFFVLSGFLITRILLETAGSKGYFRAFYGRRVLRIFPLYFVFLGLYFFLLPRVLGRDTPDFMAQVWSWCFLENVGQTFPTLGSQGPAHYWSLAVEEHFYLVWPFIVASFSRRTLLRIIVAVLVLSPVLRFVVASHGQSVFFLTPTRLDGLSLGAGLAILLARPAGAPAWLLPLARTVFLVLPLVLLPLFVVYSGSHGALLQAFKHSLISLFYAGFVALCLVDDGMVPIRRLLELRWLRWIGSISFGLYVFHPACYDVIAHFFPGVPILQGIALAFGLSVFCAWVSFRFMESPFLSMKRYFTVSTDHRKETCVQNIGVAS